MATVPDLATVRAYVRVPATTLDDADLQRMMDTAEADQSARCVWTGPTGIENDPDEYPVALSQAFLRRVQREIAGRNLPLGMVGLEAEYGPTSIPAFDALVEHHEHAFRRVVLS